MSFSVLVIKSDDIVSSVPVLVVNSCLILQRSLTYHLYIYIDKKKKPPKHLCLIIFPPFTLYLSRRETKMMKW